MREIPLGQYSCKKYFFKSGSAASAIVKCFHSIWKMGAVHISISITIIIGGGGGGGGGKEMDEDTESQHLKIKGWEKFNISFRVLNSKHLVVVKVQVCAIVASLFADYRLDSQTRRARTDRQTMVGP